VRTLTSCLRFGIPRFEWLLLSAMASQSYDETIKDDGGKGGTLVATPRRVESCVRAVVHGETKEFSDDEQKFLALADEWLDSQCGRSRIDFSHPAHLQIIGMGTAAIPFLLNEIRERSGHWFEAIRSIVGSSPVTPDMRGDFEAVTNAWLKWGAQNGYGATQNRKRDLDAGETA